jgi:hypothetical protein
MRFAVEWGMATPDRVAPRSPIGKADPAALDDDLRRLLAGWSDKAYPDHTLFLTMARRPGMLRAIMGFVRYMFGASLIERPLVEMVRIKTAWNNQCRH